MAEQGQRTESSAESNREALPILLAACPHKGEGRRDPLEHLPNAGSLRSVRKRHDRVLHQIGNWCDCLLRASTSEARSAHIPQAGGMTKRSDCGPPAAALKRLSGLEVSVSEFM